MTDIESHKRTFVKSVIWRLIATGTTILTAYAISKDISSATKIGAIDQGVKFFLYYAYERVFPKGRAAVDLGKKTTSPQSSQSSESTQTESNTLQHVFTPSPDPQSTLNYII